MSARNPTNVGTETREIEIDSNIYCLAQKNECVVIHTIDWDFEVLEKVCTPLCQLVGGLLAVEQSLHNFLLTNTNRKLIHCTSSSVMSREKSDNNTSSFFSREPLLFCCCCCCCLLEVGFPPRDGNCALKSTKFITTCCHLRPMGWKLFIDFVSESLTQWMINFREGRWKRTSMRLKL